MNWYVIKYEDKITSGRISSTEKKLIHVYAKNIRQAESMYYQLMLKEGSWVSVPCSVELKTDEEIEEL